MIRLTETEWWMLTISALSALPMAVLGCFLVLRRMSMLGDAISHAVLPGIVMAFILGKTRSAGNMFAGAMAAGLVTAGLSAGLTRHVRIAPDAALGVVFSVMFSLGVALLAWAPSGLDLDPSCVLYGVLETAAVARSGAINAPDDALVLAPIGLLSIALVAIFFRPLRLATFDPGLARALGFAPGIIGGVLVCLVAMNVVASFRVVGSVLPVAMLVTPAATAQLICDRLPRMVLVSAACALSAVVVGCILAINLSARGINVPAAGMMAVVAGVQFALAAAFAPRQGLLAKRLATLSISLRIAREDALAALYRIQEQPVGAVAFTPGTSLVPRLAFRQLRRAGLVRPSTSAHAEWALTDEGVRVASRIVSSHRLWESYLARHTALPLDHLHDPSHRVEHFVSPEMLEAIRKDIADATDPHGKPIPPAG